MERFTFYAASAAFCLFLTVALTSAMTSDCLCDGLPGNQCDYCEQVPANDETPVAATAGYQGQYYRAWQEEHDEFHHQWVAMHGEFHVDQPSVKAEVEFHVQMEEAHDSFHGILEGSAGSAR